MLNQNMNAGLLGAIYMIIGGAIYAVINTATQYLTMNMGVNSTNMAFWQYFIALIATLPWLIKMGTDSLKTKRMDLQLIRVFFSALGVQCWVYALANGVPIWQAIALLMTSPFFVVLGAKIFLGERVDLHRILATLVGFVGGMIILQPWTDGFKLITLMPVGAAIFWAGASLIVKKLSYTESPSSITMYLFLLLTPINFAATYFDTATLSFTSTFSLPEMTALYWLIGVGILTAIAQAAFVMAYKVADAAFVQPFDHLKLPLNSIAGAIVFGWLPPGNLYVGAALIIGASLYILYQDRQENLQTA